MGDKLLYATQHARIDLVRGPGEDGEERTLCLFEMRGSADVDDETVEVIDGLVREFRSPQEGGDAHAS